MLEFTKDEMRAYVEGKLPTSKIIEAKKWVILSQFKEQ